MASNKKVAKKKKKAATVKKRTKAERELDLVFIADLYLRHRTQVEMRDELNAMRRYNISRSQIMYDINAIHGRWLESSLIDFDKVKARELARIDRLEREYWVSWIESKEDQEVSTTSRSTGIRAYERAELKRVGQVGNPRFLEGVQWCIEQRMKIFGFYAPTRVDLEWRREAEAAGLQASDIFEQIVAKYMAAIAGSDEPIAG